MELSLYDIIKIAQVNWPKKLDLSIGSFYVKNIEDAYPLNLAIGEVLGYYIAKDIGLMCPKYKIVMPDNKDEEVFVISEDLNNYGKFISAFDLGLLREQNASLSSIEKFLEKNFLNNPVYGSKIPEVFNNIIKMYIFDILLCNWDRRSNNWGLIFTKDNMQLAIFDNENLLDRDFNHTISSQDNGVEWLKNIKRAMTDDERKERLISDLTNFFESFNNEYILLFENIFNLITPEYFKKLLDQIEREEVIITKNGKVPLEIFDKEDYVKIYSDRYYLVKDIYHKHRRSR